MLPANGDASFGAAVVAGIGVGVFTGVDDAVARCCRSTSTHQPSAAAHDRYSAFFEVYRDAQQHLVAINHRLHDLTVAPSIPPG